MSRCRVVVLALAVGLMSSAGCTGGRSTPATIVLVTLDTTRADHLGCYGDADASTPVLDRFAADGVRFDQAQAPVAVTQPSHSSMFTGQVPPVHGVRYNGMFRLPDSADTFAERLRAAGWVTAGIPASFALTIGTGIGQGFDDYLDMFAEGGTESLPMDAERSAGEMTDLASAWLRARAPSERVALWVHYWDPHAPYAPPFPFSAKFRDRPYDGEIAYVDRELGRLFDVLRELERWDDALVMVVGDHGEGLYDHDESSHGLLTYESTMRVPFLVRAPGMRAGHVIERPVTVADVGPTIVDYAGVEPLPETQGVSLREAIGGGEAPDRALYFESLVGSLLYGYSPIEGLRRGPWKWIRSTKPELYRLDDDPDEQVDLAPNDPGVGRDLDAVLTERLSAWQAESGDRAEAATEAPLDAEALERLASLGYVGGTVSASRRDGPAPRDMVHLEGTIVDGRDRAASGQHEAALHSWRAVLAKSPSNRYALQEASYAAERIGRRDEALGFARRLVELYPEFLPGVVQFGMLHVEAGDPARAVDIFRAGLEHHPDDASLRYRVVLALLDDGRTDEAEREIEDALARGIDEPDFVLARALCAAREGRGEDALRDLDRAIADGYDRVDVLRAEPMLAPLRGVPGARERIDALAGAAESGGG